MLGSTLDLGDDFEELLVFSTMLGSTVALGDDFVELHVFCAMLGSTVDTILGDTSSLYSALEARQWIHGAASLRGHSTGAALGQGCRARCVRGKYPDPEARRCRSCSSFSRSSTFPSVRRDSFPRSHFSDTIEVSVAVH